MKIEASIYLFFSVISLIVSFIYGRSRNIGITWSIIFSVFCGICALPVILFSKKKDNNTSLTTDINGVYMY